MSKSISKISKIVSLVSALGLSLVPSTLAMSNVEDNSMGVNGAVETSSSDVSVSQESTLDLSGEDATDEGLGVNNSGVNPAVEQEDLGKTYANMLLSGDVAASKREPDMLEEYLDNQSWVDQGVACFATVISAAKILESVSSVYRGYKDSSLRDSLKNNAMNLFLNTVVSGLSGLIAYKSFKASVNADNLRGVYSTLKSYSSMMNSSDEMTNTPENADDNSTSPEAPDASMAMKILM